MFLLPSWLRHCLSLRSALERVRAATAALVCDVICPHIAAVWAAAGAASGTSVGSAPPPPPLTELFFQSMPALRCVPPSDMRAGRPHRDRDYGHQPGQLNFWLPLSKAEVTGTVFTYCPFTYCPFTYRAVTYSCHLLSCHCPSAIFSLALHCPVAVFPLPARCLCSALSTLPFYWLSLSFHCRVRVPIPFGSSQTCNTSRRRVCHFADTLPPSSLLKHRLTGEWVQQNDSLADGMYHHRKHSAAEEEDEAARPLEGDWGTLSRCPSHLVRRLQ